MVNSTDGTDDQTYSIEFLDHEWDGAGSGCDLSCVFDEKRVTPAAFIGFISELRKNYRLEHASLTTHDESDEEINVYIEEQEIYENDAWLDPCRLEIPDAASVSIRDNVDPNSGFTLYFYAPNNFELGAGTEFFYLGSRNDDRRRIEHFVSVALQAQKFFGNGAALFGDESYVWEHGKDLDKKLATPNLTADSGDHWINEILNISKQWRPENEIEFQRVSGVNLSGPPGRWGTAPWWTRIFRWWS